MNIVFLVHYFPPLNSTGARRVLALAKYLSRWGHQITVISTRKSRGDGILSEPVPSYVNLLEVPKPTQIDSPSKPITANQRSWLGLLLVKIKRIIMQSCGQMIDHRLLFACHFLKPSLQPQIEKALNEADVLISSCPPWPVHLAAMICAKRFKKKWIADYRDQFSDNHVFPGNRLSRFLEVAIEKKLLREAEALTVISSPMQEYYLQFHPKVYLIENGFDAENFQIEHILEKSSSHRVIRYFGSVSKYRIPKVFFQALSQLESDIQVEFYGEAQLAKDEIEKHYPQLKHQVTFYGLIPHPEAIQLMLSADALFLQEASAISNTTSLSSQGTMTTKLFEYMGAQKPIIAEVDAKTLLSQTIVQSGLAVSCTNDSGQMQKDLTAWLSGEKNLQPNIAYIHQFSRESQAQRFDLILQGFQS